MLKTFIPEGATPTPDNQVIWSPQSGPQTALLQCPVFEVFYGGARGGGKTEGSIGDWLQHSALYGKHAVGIFFRRKLKQLEEVIARTKQLFPLLGAKFNEQKKEWTMKTGARLKFAYLERDIDAEEYQGHNYTRVYVEEVTNFPNPGPINKLKATLRSAVGVPVGMRLTGNPGGPGHVWVKKRYIDPDPRGYKIIDDICEIDTLEGKQTIKLSYVFIPSKIGDNQLLIKNDPTYILRLRQSGSAALVKAWLEGDWNIIDGAFFDEWDETKHVLHASDGWIQRFPRIATRFCAMDWGSAKPFSVGWYIVSDGKWGLPAGALLKYREWYGASGPNKGIKMTADMVAKGILERERAENDFMSYRVADPAIFIRDGGPSIGETMAMFGATFRRADNKRKSGAEEFRRRLTGLDGVPLLYFLDVCEASITTIPVLQHDDTDPEDVDTDAEDHAYDETRYAIMSRPKIKTAPPLPHITLPKGILGKTFNELVEMNKRRRLQQQEI